MKTPVLFVYCMPRSQSAWLSVTLSSIGVPCVHEPVYNLVCDDMEWIDKWLILHASSRFANDGNPRALAFVGSELCVYREQIDAHMKTLEADYVAHHACLLRSPADVHHSLSLNTPLGDCPAEFINRIHHLIQQYRYDMHLTYPIGKPDVLKIMRMLGVPDYAGRHSTLDQMDRMKISITEKHLKQICDDARNEH